MNDSNFARTRTLFLLPFSNVRRSAVFGVVAMATLHRSHSQQAPDNLCQS